MRMHFGLIIGVLILLIGLGIIVNVVFGVHVPVFRIVVGLLFILLGFKIIIGGWTSPGSSRLAGTDVVFHQRTILAQTGGQVYNAIFGQANVDLRSLSLGEAAVPVEVNAIFGTAEVWVRPDQPLRVKADAAFGAVDLPENSASGFGSTTYTTGGFQPQAGHIELKAAAVFGEVKVVIKP